MMPALLAFFTFAGFLISKAVPKYTMELNPTLSLLGMLYSALYITLVKVVLSYWECPPNPAAEATLGKYKEVICDSEDHKGAIGAMVLGMICYCFGFFAITTWAAVMTPKMYMELWF